MDRSLRKEEVGAAAAGARARRERSVYGTLVVVDGDDVDARKVGDARIPLWWSIVRAVCGIAVVMVVIFFFARRQWATHHLSPLPLTRPANPQGDYQLAHNMMRSLPKKWLQFRYLGRLGNNLQQWAAAMTIAEHNNMTLCLKNDTTSRERVRENSKIWKNFPWVPNECDSETVFGEEKWIEWTAPANPNFVEEVLTFTRSTSIAGYFQSFRFYCPLTAPVAEVFRNLKYTELVEEAANEILQPFLDDNKTTVAVHVRLTDYADYARREYRASVAPTSYFRRAMAYIRRAEARKTHASAERLLMDTTSRAQQGATPPWISPSLRNATTSS